MIGVFVKNTLDANGEMIMSIEKTKDQIIWQLIIRLPTASTNFKWRFFLQSSIGKIRLPKGQPKKDKTDRLMLRMELISDDLLRLMLLNLSCKRAGSISKTADNTVKLCPLGALLLDSKR